MLIDFTVENFRSIKNEQTLSMLATNLRRHPDNLFPTERERNISLLKTAVVYGANASGKSNLIKATNALREFVVKSTDLKLHESIPYYEPHKLDRRFENRPTRFEMEFVAQDKIRYKYSVLFNEKEIEREELVFHPKGQEARLFLRQKGEKMRFGDYLKGRKQNVAHELLANNLFLSKAANSNNEQMKTVYLYFLHHLHILTDDFLSSHSTTELLLSGKKTDKRFKEKVGKFLLAADTGISSVKLKKRTPGMERLKDGNREMTHRPVFLHTSYDGKDVMGTVRFELADESEGTKKMYDLAGGIIRVLESGSACIIDEIDNSLHPLISAFIIRLFNDPAKNPRNAQFVAATHDSTLLNPDLLRRDQIWFVEKDTYGATELYSLVEFERREVGEDTLFDNWYLAGRFGALPVINRKIFNLFGEEDQGHAEKEKGGQTEGPHQTPDHMRG